ncbi:hypothetical protein SAMN05216285_2345 [Natrinema salifodinae]|uniref:Uncharacterized protein n=1 Tax=Natrinema salifodinae TaxID=1202768 RepID=A0A1I0PCM2_9EURY|nr:hypothetical protein SAMN05216285_2345 [Natrinema salifodinae]
MPLYDRDRTPEFRCNRRGDRPAGTPECRCIASGPPEREPGVSRIRLRPSTGFLLYRCKRVSIGTVPVVLHPSVPLYAETHTPRCRCKGLAVWGSRETGDRRRERNRRGVQLTDQAGDRSESLPVISTRTAILRSKPTERNCARNTQWMVTHQSYLMIPSSDSIRMVTEFRSLIVDNNRVSVVPERSGNRIPVILEQTRSVGDSFTRGRSDGDIGFRSLSCTLTAAPRGVSPIPLGDATRFIGHHRSIRFVGHYFSAQFVGLVGPPNRRGTKRKQIENESRTNRKAKTCRPESSRPTSTRERYSSAQISTKFRKICRPVSPLFSGWNCVPKTLPASLATIDGNSRS